MRTAASRMIERTLPGRGERHADDGMQSFCSQPFPFQATLNRMKESGE